MLVDRLADATDPGPADAQPEVLEELIDAARGDTALLDERQQRLFETPARLRGQ